MLDQLQFTPWVLVPLAAVVLAAATARYAWAQRREAGGPALVALAVATGWWALGQAAVFSAGGLDSQIALTRLEYLGLAFAPLAWLWFAMEYTGRGQILRGPVGLVAVIPIMTSALAATNQSHGLVWRQVGRWQGTGPGVALEAGPWFMVQAVFGYVAVAAATGVLLWHHAQSPHHRGRLVWVVAAPALALLLNAPGLYGLAPPGWVDLTPLGFSVAGFVLVAGLMRPGMQVVAPVARTIVVEEMRDAIVVLDRQGRIVDLNRAAAETLGLEQYGPVPVPLGTAWARARGEVPEKGAPPVSVRLVTTSEEERAFEMTLTALGPRGGPGRTVLVLRDVTERERMEADLREAGAALREMNARLEEIINTDGLTGLASRRHFIDVLRREVERSDRYKRPLALVLADLDNFKGVNDTHGHAAGDDVLRASGEALLSLSRDADLAGRLGGEELALLLPETDDEGAAAMAERLRERIEGRLHRAPSGQTFRVTASLGVATLRVGEDSEALLQAADEALYDAKRAGRNQVVVLERDDDPESTTGTDPA